MLPSIIYKKGTWYLLKKQTNPDFKTGFVFMCFQYKLLQSSRFPQRFRSIGLFPGEALVFAPEVPVSRGLAVNGAAQVQVADDGAGAQVEVLTDQFGDLLIGDFARAEGLDVDRERVRHANGVSHLDLAAVSQPGSHHVLGHPAAGVRR